MKAALISSGQTIATANAKLCAATDQSTNTTLIRVLLVEDNPVEAMRLRQMLSRARTARIAVESVPNLAAAIERIAQGDLDLVMLDLTLRDSEGIDSFLCLSYAAPTVPIIVLASPATEAVGIEAVQLGAQDCLLKARVSAEELGRALRCALERHRVVASLRGLSLTDEMTGLLNRRGFQTMGTGHLRLGNRTGSRFLLFFIDVDDLKRINDTWGHHEGDHAIMHTAEVLRATFRQSDIVARYGGDEFAVLALDTSSDQGMVPRARLEANLVAMGHRPGTEYSLGLSVGVVAFDALHDRPLAELLKEADQALYREKFARP